MRSRSRQALRFTSVTRLRLAPEHGSQRLLDLLLAGGAGDLVAGEIGHVEDVDRLFAECGDLRRGDIEAEANSASVRS